MREIKFRAWNKSGEEMIPPMDIQNMIHQKVSTIPLKMLYEDLEFLQFTGLLDKNKKEIYEGDIVSVDIGTKRFPKTVNKEISYFEEYGIFGMRGHQSYGEVDFTIPMGSHGSSTKYSPYLLSSYWRRNIEVIGNIHENPELINILIGLNYEECVMT